MESGIYFLMLLLVEPGQSLINRIDQMLHKNNINFFKQRKAQGILEVVIAISVIIIGLVSIMSLVVFNINVQGYNHNMLIASNLAREGVEVVRNMRDSNWLNSKKDWDDSLITASDAPIGKEKGFLSLHSYFWSKGTTNGYVLYDTGCTWDECISEKKTSYGSSPAKLSLLTWKEYSFYDHFASLYDLGPTQDSPFYRVIFINEICDVGGKEKILTEYSDHCEDYSYPKIGLQVISKVGWGTRDLIRTLEVEERLYNWK
jgi:hypothetical protein